MERTMKKRTGLTAVDYIALITIVGISIMALMPYVHLVITKDGKHSQTAGKPIQMAQSPSIPATGQPSMVLIDGHEYIHSPTCPHPMHFSVTK